MVFNAELKSVSCFKSGSTKNSRTFGFIRSSNGKCTGLKGQCTGHFNLSITRRAIRLGVEGLQINIEILVVGTTSELFVSIPSRINRFNYDVASRPGSNGDIKRRRILQNELAAVELDRGISSIERIILRKGLGFVLTINRALDFTGYSVFICIGLCRDGQNIAGAERDILECLRSSRSHACAERERSDSGGDNGLCTLSLDARCGFVNHHQRTTCFREDHLEITIHSFTPRIMRFFLRRRLHVVNRTSARSTDGSVGMDVSTSWGGGKPYVDFLKTV